MTAQHFDIVVIGGGPAGINAAIEAAESGRDVLLLERGREFGGECVHRGTIPSKSLRGTAAYLRGLRDRAGGVIDLTLSPDVRVASLMARLRSVVTVHEHNIARQLEQAGARRMHGIARFVSDREVEAEPVRGDSVRFTADVFVIATGSRPRVPANVPVDHEHILDSDSILSIAYLPRTLTVLGGGVIACEYASTFATLGVEVTMIDRAPRPLAFLDADLSAQFVECFEQNPGCRYLGEQDLRSAGWDGVSAVVTETDRQTVRSEKLLAALGRVANLDDLCVAAAGLTVTDRGVLSVDEFCRTAVPHIYAAGDVVGPPALASTATEQGRRAIRHALAMPLGAGADTLPAGIYTIPEISTVGMTESEAVEVHGGAVCGEARYDELTRGHLACSTDGYLKLVCDPDGRRVLGAQIIGEGATELIHVAQMALAAESDVDAFVENIFNFPTLAEAYRIAALRVVRQRAPVSVAD